VKSQIKKQSPVRKKKLNREVDADLIKPPQKNLSTCCAVGTAGRITKKRKNFLCFPLLELWGEKWAGPLDRADKNASRSERDAPPAVRFLISMCHLAIASPWMDAT
jgi:hypothetical protein